MSSYTTTEGDTFEVISRRVYGTETQADLVRNANPGSVDPFTGGIILTLPRDPFTPENLPQTGTTGGVDDVEVFINGSLETFFTGVSVVRSIDKISSAELSAPFDIDNQRVRQLLKPFEYQLVEILIGGEVVFRGTIINVIPSSSVTGRSIRLQAYGLPGVLVDCTAPSELAPLEFNNQGLREIAERMVKPFGIKVFFNQVDPGAPFEQVAANPGTKVFAFLATLAAQRNMVISDFIDGSLVFQQSTTEGQQVAQFIEGVSPLMTIRPLFNAQEYYSHITGIEPAFIGFDGEKFTAKNDRLEIVRPLSYSIPDTESGDIPTAVNTKMGRMFANMVSYTAQVNSWRDDDDLLWMPNTTINVQAPGAMIYENYELLIRSVELVLTTGSKVANMNLIFPGSLSGQIPEVLPWD